jgi:NOL1/NOP2/fmu family ribosome biogenesis protein
MDVGAAGRQWRRNLGQEFALVVCGGRCLRLRVERRGEHCLAVAISSRRLVRCVVENVGFRWEMESLLATFQVDARKRVQVRAEKAGESLGGSDMKVAQAI